MKTDIQFNPFQAREWLQRPSDELTRSIGRLTMRELDQLPFAVVLLTREADVVYSNASLLRVVGRRDRNGVIGTQFFDDLVTSARVPRFQGRFMVGALSGTLDERFSFTFRFTEQTRHGRVRMVSDRTTNLVWLLIDFRVSKGHSRPVGAECAELMKRRAS